MDSDVDDFDTDDGEIDDESPKSNRNTQNESTSASNDDELKGLVGLINLGNTCYMNGALQALSNCQQLTRFVLDCPGFLKDSGLCQSYTELIREIWSPNNSSRYTLPSAIISPSSIIRNIKCIYPAFRGCSQQDTQEFLRCFLEQLHDELKQPVIRRHSTDSTPFSNTSSSSASNSTEDSPDLIASTSSSGGDTNENSVIVQNTSCQKPDNDFDSQRSIISDTFEFRISSSVVCSNCNNISTTKETFKDLSIPIPSRDHPYYQISSDPDDDKQQEESHSMKIVSSDKTSNTASEALISQKHENIDDTTGGNNKTVPDETRSEPNDIKFDGRVESLQRMDLQSSYFIDAIPLARWFLNWFSSLGSWFWGPKVTLNDCLSIFFGTDPLEGDNEYSCEVCTKKNRGVKFLKIIELPEVLCIHFKRYESVGSAKITTHVSFPLTGLDLAPFMSEDSRSQCTTYNLIACICHHGSALLTGHYTTYALNCYDDQWYEYDDQYVSCVSGYQVENSEAYILFYQKSTMDDTTDRQRVRASKLLKKSLRNDSINKYFISKQWVNKFNTFVEPGPITNYDFLCKHEKVPKKKIANVSELCHPISDSVWNYLMKLHGGGPICQDLKPCETCE